MIICDRCSTENLDGARYCDECGAALWLAGRPGAVSPNGERGTSGGPDLNRAAPGTAGSNVTQGGAPSPVQQTFAVVEADNKKTHARLVIERGRSAGKQFPLSNPEAQIGRWDADGGIFPDIDLDDDDPEAKVSRRHACISLNDGEYSIEDLGSTNGTFINRGRRLVPGDKQSLRDGDEIIVGKTFLRFHVTK
jgi:pSer/pThr/pTyr-binding forkhead associated (FHA) protein